MKPNGRIHAATQIKPGGRYDRFIRFMESRAELGATGMEIRIGARVEAVSAIVSELRSLGFKIDCKPDGRTQDGSNPHRYWLMEKPSKLAQGDLFGRSA